MERANRKKFWQKQSFKSNAYGNTIWKSLPRSMEPDDVRKLLKKRHNLRDKCDEKKCQRHNHGIACRFDED